MSKETSTEHRYKVAYKTIHLGEGKTKAEIQADPELDGCGATDKFILISTIEPESGGRSVQWSSSDGEGNSLSDRYIFNNLVFIARNLAIRGELDKTREEVCWLLWNMQLQQMGMPEQGLEEARRIFKDQ